jgi:hypothetical protein
MARQTPEKLAQALKANLRRRKAGAAVPPPEKHEKAPESPPEKPQPAQS